MSTLQTESINQPSANVAYSNLVTGNKFESCKLHNSIPLTVSEKRERNKSVMVLFDMIYILCVEQSRSFVERGRIYGIYVNGSKHS